MKALLFCIFMGFSPAIAMHEAKYAHDDIKENMHSKLIANQRLFNAIHKFSLDEVKDAIAEGADINAVKKYISQNNNVGKVSPLMWAISCTCLWQNNQPEKYIPVVTFLLEQHNLDLNYYDKIPFANALLIAMYVNNKDITKLLLDRGINVSGENPAWGQHNFLEKNLAGLKFTDEIKQIFREKVEEYKEIAGIAATAIDSATDSSLGKEIESIILGYVA